MLNTVMKALRQPLKHIFSVLSASSLVLALAINPAPAEAKTHKHSAKTKIAKTSHVARSVKYGHSSASRTARGMKVSLNHGPRYQSRRYSVAAPLLAAASVGVMAGLHATPDPLALKSSVAFVVDANTGEVLLDKNSTTALPIASITKLMTALVVMEAHQDLDERLMIDEADLQLEKQVRSRLPQGVQLRRREALQLALMASENRAANMLTRYYPGGKTACVDAMNRKAAQLGMTQSYFVEGTGLASANMASAQDLVKLMKAASAHPLIRELSTQSGLTLVGSTGQELSFHSTNRLVGNPEWDILLQKTGFINAAGQCLVMYANLEGRSVMMVLLDSSGKLSRIADAARVRAWLATQAPNATFKPASLPYPS
jgi:serine-type D-Ala-D-Ala endopeptidase (penicillin-binding protein 7)